MAVFIKHQIEDYQEIGSLGLDRTEHLLIDEFQDTSQGDIEILLPLIDEILSGRGERDKME